MNPLRNACIFAIGLATLIAKPTMAQQSAARDSLLRSAFAADQDRDAERAIAMLTAGVDTSRGPPNDLWSEAVQLLAQLQRDAGLDSTAAAWLRWALRIAPNIRVPSGMPSGPLESARAFVTGTSAADATTTLHWEWPTTPSAPNALGGLRVDPRQLPPGAVTVVVGPGGGDVPRGQVVSLRPGSYTIRARAPGYRPAEVTGELLPGINTVVTFNLLSDAEATERELARTTLGPAVRARTLRQLVRLRTDQESTTCVTGFVAGRGGLILTRYSTIHGARTLTATFANNRRDNDLQVAAYDRPSDIAVLIARVSTNDSLPLASTVEEGEAAWHLGFPQCGSSDVNHADILEWPARLDRLRLRQPLLWANQGGPLVNRSGEVLGIAAGPQEGVPFTVLATVLDSARAHVRTRNLMSMLDVAVREGVIPAAQIPATVSGGGGFPWPLALVAGAVGTAIAVFAAGGGADDGGGNSSSPGGIIVTLPKN